MTAACSTIVEREAHVQQIAGALISHGWSAERCLTEARRAVESAERVGMDAGVTSPRPTSDVVREHIEAVMWLAARGEPLPQSEEAMRAVAEQKRARDVFAMLGVAFPWV